MALFVNTNVTSLNSRRQLTNATNNLNTTYQRLSSGLRINSAKDDSAGLQISDRLTAQINGLNQGNRNTNDGIALAQTVEGAMDEMTTMLQRIRTLAVQASNGTNTTDDRLAIQKEVSALSHEITRISCKTTFAGKTVLNGGFKGADQVGANSLWATSGNMVIHAGANSGDTLTVSMTTAFSVSGMKAEVDAAGKIGAGEAYLTSPSADGGTTVFNVSSRSSAEATLAIIDKYIQKVDSKRADLGAMQNRMESTIRNQSNISQNEADARSRIRDTDFAEETANLNQQSIIQQAATSMLMQANARPQVALSLLG